MKLMDTAEYRNSTLHKLYAATSYERKRVNITPEDFRKRDAANTAVDIVIRHTPSLNWR